MRYGEFDTASLMYITNRPDLVFERGEGAWLYDHNGKRYLDFIQGWAVNCLGHCPPEIRDALVKQASTLLNPSPAFYNGPMVELAGLLTANSVFDRVFFANTGAEANEGALVRKPEVYLFDDSLSALDMATDARLRAALTPYTRDAVVLMVAQRVTSIKHADQILVLEDGEPVGLGSHDQLLANCPTYVEIVQSQLTAEEAAA